MKLLKTFFSKKAWDILWISALFLLGTSLLYNIAWIYIFSAFQDPRTQFFLLAVLSLLSSYGSYVLCTTCWQGYRSLHVQGLVTLWLYQAFQLFLYFAIITPLATHFAWAAEILSAFGFVFWAPCTLAWYRTLYDGNFTLKNWFQNLKNRKLWELCSGLLLAVMAVDTLTGGSFTLAAGIHPVSLFGILLLQGNPVMVPLVHLILGHWLGFALHMAIALVVTWLEVCVIHAAE